MLRDPIELYEYPREWCNGDSFEKVRSGLYILTPDGWLRRGITTATTASAAVNAAIASLYEDVSEVDVVTPVGITLKIKVKAENGTASARKFAGDHAFDVTDGIVVRAVAKNDGIKFGKGIGFVSKAAVDQISRNFDIYREKYDYKGGVLIEVPDGELIARKTRNPIPGGISILGTTGFVEPWCEKLVKTKIEIARQYKKIAVTTGRRGWRFALENFRDYQPFVFGVHITEILKNFDGEIIIVGLPKLLFKWAGANSREAVLRKAKELNKNVVDVVLL